MGAPCRVTFGDRVFFKPDFIKRFLDTLHLEDDVVENSKYLKSIRYDNAFNEGDPLLIREKKEEAKAEVSKKKTKEELDKEFKSLNNKYVKDSKLLDETTDPIIEREIQDRLDDTQMKMSEVSSQLEALSEKETQTTETSIFDDFDSTNKGKSIKSKAEANKAFKEKYGEDAAVAKAISSNFEAIADELKAKGIFTKIKC
jgi:hypothetical protein